LFRGVPGENVLAITLSSPNPQIGQFFGWSVAVSDKYVVVGTYFEFYGQNVAGVAYQFDAKTGARIGVFTSPHPQGGGLFGYSVAVSGDIVVVGAPGETSTTGGAGGHAYIFDAATGNLNATLASPTPVHHHRGQFGWSVALSDNCVVVGAPFEDSIVANEDVPQGGNAYVFDISGALRHSLHSFSLQASGYFGISVGASGDSARGLPRVIVGASGESGAAGNAYLYDAGSGSQIATLQSFSAQPNGQFGYSVAATSDMAVVGAPGESVGGLALAGNAYLFNAKTGAPLGALARTQPQDGGQFGTSVAVTENPIFGHADPVVVGAPWESVGAMSISGNVYTFDSLTGHLVATGQSPHAQVGGLFGISVAVAPRLLPAGDFTIVVGAAFETVEGFPADASLGKAYIF
jgi:hypothetical protein